MRAAFKLTMFVDFDFGKCFKFRVNFGANKVESIEKANKFARSKMRLEGEPVCGIRVTCNRLSLTSALSMSVKWQAH